MFIIICYPQVIMLKMGVIVDLPVVPPPVQRIFTSATADPTETIKEFKIIKENKL